jgi:hypothetical protein
MSQVELQYGNIDINNIPIVMNEPISSSYWRMTSWLSLIIIILFILFLFIMSESNKNKEIRYQTNKMLITEKNTKIKRCDLLNNNAQPPCAKSIELIISKSSFPNITLKDLNCLFSSYNITTIDGKFLQLKGIWNYFGDSYHCLLVLPNYTNLSSLVLHILINQLFAKGWSSTFKSFNILVRDKSDKVIWRDTVIIDFITGDSTAGNIGDGYIPIQFDLNKYYIS